jgi:Tol biopolymer transport system component
MEVYPSITQDGTLYFSSNREGGKGKGDIYRSLLVDGQYGEPENIGEPINTENSEGDVFIAHDESYIIFGSSGRSDSHGSGDLYISFRQSDGSWTEPTYMGDQINTNAFEYCPTVSPDGKYFFFTSYKKPEKDGSQKLLSLDDIMKIYAIAQNGLGDIYWMDARVIEEFR